MSSLWQTARASVTACGPQHLSLRAVHAILRPEFQRDADDLVALLQQQRRRGGGVHPTAHAADDAPTLLRIHSGTLYNARAACKMVCAQSVWANLFP